MGEEKFSFGSLKKKVEEIRPTEEVEEYIKEKGILEGTEMRANVLPDVQLVTKIKDQKPEFTLEKIKLPTREREHDEKPFEIRRPSQLPKKPRKSKMDILYEKIESLFQENKELKINLMQLEKFRLTEENILKYFYSVKYAKKYELYRSFFPHDTKKIEDIVDKFFKKKVLTHVKGHWIALTKDFRDKFNRISNLEMNWNKILTLLGDD